MPVGPVLGEERRVAEFETVDLRIDDDRVAWVTLNRPDKLNAFDFTMLDELQSIWRSFRRNPDVHAIVLTAAGDRAFCTGIDRDAALGDGKAEAIGAQDSPFHFDDPGYKLGPKTNDLWKPVIAAVNGMACGGAFYLLGEVDIIVAAEDATFFDPHVTYGMAAVFETVHIAQKMPLGEVLRMQLMGGYERLSAQRAHQIGFVSEVVPREQLLDAAGHVARTIAGQPNLAVQATVRSAWTAAEVGRQAALRAAVDIVEAGNTPEQLMEGQKVFSSGKRVEWKLR